jgi:hypothetical protein
MVDTIPEIASTMTSKMVPMIPFGANAAGSYAREAEKDGAN